MKTKKLSTKFESPRIPLDLPNKSDVAMNIQSEDCIQRGKFQDCYLDNKTLDRVTFDEVIFSNVNFSHSNFTNLELTDVIFDKCDLSNADFSNSSIHRTTFRNCKLIGMDLSESKLRNVLFTNCLGEFSNFRFANMKQVNIEDCTFASTDYCYSTLKHVNFLRSNIDQSQYSGAKHDGLDFSTCEFSTLSINLDDLKGCSISKHQAYVFAGLLDLVIKDSDTSE